MFQITTVQRIPLFPKRVKHVFSKKVFTGKPVTFRVRRHVNLAIVMQNRAREQERDDAVACVLDELLTNVFLNISLFHHDDIVADSATDNTAVVQVITRHEVAYPDNYASPFFPSAREEVKMRIFGRTPSKIDLFLRSCVATFDINWMTFQQVVKVAKKHNIKVPSVHVLCASVYGVHHATHPRAWGQYFPYFELGYQQDKLFLRLSREFFLFALL